jgi:hypothetical protein
VVAPKLKSNIVVHPVGRRWRKGRGCSPHDDYDVELKGVSQEGVVGSDRKYSSPPWGWEQKMLQMPQTDNYNYIADFVVEMVVVAKTRHGNAVTKVVLQPP